MKLYNPFLLAVLASLGLAATSARAVVIDFESFNDGDVISGPGVFSDVEFNSDGRTLLVSTIVPGPGFSGAKTVVPDPFSGSLIEASFSISNINFVSVTLGDFGADAEDIYLRAYDSTNGLLDSDTAFLGSLFGGITLSVYGGSGIISYVEFGGTGQDFPNSLYFDNFSYEFSGTEPPPPPPTRVPDAGATSVLIMIGLGLLGAVRRFSR